MSENGVRGRSGPIQDPLRPQAALKEAALPTRSADPREFVGPARFNGVKQERAAAAQRIHRSMKAERKTGGGDAAKPTAIPQSGGAPLDGGLRKRMEPKLGADLSGVRVHTHGESARAAQDLNARAFTVGSEVHFNRGEYQPGTKEGDRLLAHELTHVVQGQKSGVQRSPDAHGASNPAAGAGAAHDVSKPGEPAEVEADKVADHVTDKLHGGKKTNKPNKKKKGKGDHEHGHGGHEHEEEEHEHEQAAKHDKAGAKDNAASDLGPGEKAPPIAAKLESVAPKLYLAPNDKTPKTVPQPEKENPDFEKDSISFEVALGGKAMGHSAATGVAKAMTDKAYKMAQIVARKGNEAAEKQKDYEKKLNEILSTKMGNAKLPETQGIAGAVGNDPAVLREVFADGNLRERLTIIFNFMRTFSDTLVQAQVKEREQFIKDLDMNGSAILTRLKLMETDTSASFVGNPKNAIGKMQNESRVDDGEKVSKRDPSQLPKGGELSKREVAFQDLKAKKDGSLDDTVKQTLKWKEGADKWKAKEGSDYVTKLHSLKLPFGAGPSGTTDRIMSVGQYMNVGDMNSVRLACIGYLLPIRAHSLHEIMTAAATYGCAFIDGKKMYTDIKPLNESDLKACGGGKFPHEAKPDTASTSTAPTTKKT